MDDDLEKRYIFSLKCNATLSARITELEAELSETKEKLSALALDYLDYMDLVQAARK